MGQRETCVSNIDLTTIVRPMQDVQTHLRALFFGAAGAGKTTSALGVGLGLTINAERPEGDATRVCLLDSERGSAAKAGRDLDLPFQHAEVMDFARFASAGRGEPPITGNDPRIYTLAIGALAPHFDVLVVDSLTHAWDGALGLVDVAAQKFGGNSHKAWSVVTPIWQALLDVLLTAPCHIIGTARARTIWEDQRGSNGKSQPVAVGVQPELRKGAEYEFDIVAQMDAAHDANIMKARSTRFDGQTIPRPGPDFGRALGEWVAGGGEPTAEWMPRVLAERGLTVEAVDAWRASLGKPGVGQLSEAQARQLVSLVLGKDATVAAIAGFVQKAGDQ